MAITARNNRCCGETTRAIPPSRSGGTIDIALPFLPATITPRCEKAGISVKIDELPARLGKARTIPLDDTLGSKRVKVLFFGGTDDVLDEHVVEVRYKDDKEVSCRD